MVLLSTMLYVFAIIITLLANGLANAHLVGSARGLRAPLPASMELYRTLRRLIFKLGKYWTKGIMKQSIQ